MTRVMVVLATQRVAVSLGCLLCAINRSTKVNVNAKTQPLCVTPSQQFCRPTPLDLTIFIPSKRSRRSPRCWDDWEERVLGMPVFWLCHARIAMQSVPSHNVAFLQLGHHMQAKEHSFSLRKLWHLYSCNEKSACLPCREQVQRVLQAADASYGGVKMALWLQRAEVD